MAAENTGSARAKHSARRGGNRAPAGRLFAYGVEYLKPMVLRDVAEALDLHESTVSRVTAGKFIGTPRAV